MLLFNCFFSVSFSRVINYINVVFEVRRFMSYLCLKEFFLLHFLINAYLQANTGSNQLNFS